MRILWLTKSVRWPKSKKRRNVKKRKLKSAQSKLSSHGRWKRWRWSLSRRRLSEKCSFSYQSLSFHCVGCSYQGRREGEAWERSIEEEPWESFRSSRSINYEKATQSRRGDWTNTSKSTALLIASLKPDGQGARPPYKHRSRNIRHGEKLCE